MKIKKKYILTNLLKLKNEFNIYLKINKNILEPIFFFLRGAPGLMKLV